MTADLVAFLHARLDEDEARALAASPGPWHLNAEQDTVLAVDDIEVVEAFALSGNQLRATAAHIARHDAERVLRDVAARRAILEAFRIVDVSGQVLPDDRNIGEADGLEEALCHLAAVYEDHPDYQETWRP